MIPWVPLAILLQPIANAWKSMGSVAPLQPRGDLCAQPSMRAHHVPFSPDILTLHRRRAHIHHSLWMQAGGLNADGSSTRKCIWSWYTYAAHKSDLSGILTPLARGGRELKETPSESQYCIYNTRLGQFAGLN